MQFDLFDNTSNRIIGRSSYKEFKEELIRSGCSKCELSKNRTHIVVDRGNPDAKILVIGEAPGENEDIQAKAFVGRAGQLFDKIMSSVKLDTNKDMLITNICKCRPPENRAPKKEEAAACIPYLKHQIALVNPGYILLLGATALKHMDPSKKNFSMEEEAGQFFRLNDYPGVDFMVLYHPAALLYNATLKPVMWEHVKEFKKRFDKRD